MLPIRGMGVPTLVLTPAHNQFCAPDAAEAIISAMATGHSRDDRLSRSLSQWPHRTRCEADPVFRHSHPVEMSRSSGFDDGAHLLVDLLGDQRDHIESFEVLNDLADA